jgi:hypothetical protein
MDICVNLCNLWFTLIAAPHDSARTVTWGRMKTDTNELAQNIGSPRRGVEI